LLVVTNPKVDFRDLHEINDTCRHLVLAKRNCHSCDLFSWKSECFATK